MRLLDEHGSIIRAPEVLEALHQLILAEPAIAGRATAITLDPQTWGSSGLHFSARMIDTGEPALLKINVPHDQLWWTERLARGHPDLIPRAFATGAMLGGERLGWVLWERVSGGLHPGWQGREFDMLLEAGVRFQIAARALAPDAQAAGALATLRIEDLAQRIEQGVRRAAPNPAGRVLRRLAEDWGWVSQCCEVEVCHGDLHMANALCRDDPPIGAALLIDYHPIRMPWACEPAKPEILNAEPTRAGCRGLVTKQAAIRARLGLSTPAAADLARLEAIVLGWWAIQMWAYIGSSPDPGWRARHTWHAECSAYIAAAAAA
jgi:hypothetical protein